MEVNIEKGNPADAKVEILERYLLSQVSMDKRQKNEIMSKILYEGASAQLEYMSIVQSEDKSQISFADI